MLTERGDTEHSRQQILLCAILACGPCLSSETTTCNENQASFVCLTTEGLSEGHSVSVDPYLLKLLATAHLSHLSVYNHFCARWCRQVTTRYSQALMVSRIWGGEYMLRTQSIWPRPGMDITFSYTAMLSCCRSPGRENTGDKPASCRLFHQLKLQCRGLVSCSINAPSYNEMSIGLANIWFTISVQFLRISSVLVSVVSFYVVICWKPTSL